MSTSRSPGEWHQVARQQAALARLGRLGLQGHDVERLLEQALAVVAETLGIGDVALFELVPERERIIGRIALEDGRLLARRSMRKVHLPLGRRSLPGFAVASGEPVVASDLLHDDRFISRAPERGVAVRSAVAAPIGWESVAFGAFVAYDRTLRSWTVEEVDFVQALTFSVIGLYNAAKGLEQFTLLGVASRVFGPEEFTCVVMPMHISR